MVDCWKEFLSEITYKPNFEISYHRFIDFDREQVTLRMMAPDSRDDRNISLLQPVDWSLDARRIPLTPVVMNRMLPSWYGEEHAKNYLRYLLYELERHEVDEWFRFNGELVFDPHANEKA